MYLKVKLMSNFRFINIDYPFKDSPQGFFLNLNSDDQKAIKADLMHLLLTKRGERLYNPNFGTDLLKFIFEPNDSLTLDNLRTDITNTVKKYIPNLVITNLSVVQSPDSEFAATITVNYTVTNTVFDITDFIIINV